METKVQVSESYLESLKKKLPPEEVKDIERNIDERFWRYNRPRSRLARRIHQLARWIEHP